MSPPHDTPPVPPPARPRRARPPALSSGLRGGGIKRGRGGSKAPLHDGGGDRGVLRDSSPSSRGRGVREPPPPLRVVDSRASRDWWPIATPPSVGPVVPRPAALSTAREGWRESGSRHLCRRRGRPAPPGVRQPPRRRRWMRPAPDPAQPVPA